MILAVDFFFELRTRVRKGQHVHALAVPLEGPHEPEEVPVAGAEEHIVEVLGLEQRVDREVQVGVGFDDLLPVFVAVTLHRLQNEVKPVPANGRPVGLLLQLVPEIRRLPLVVDGHVSVGPQHDRALRFGQGFDDLVPDPPATVPH